jgi:CheY-like chemotaxis protein
VLWIAAGDRRSGAIWPAQVVLRRFSINSHSSRNQLSRGALEWPHVVGVPWMIPMEDVSPRTARRILVVEDDPLIRLSIAEELRDAGFEVIEAVDADEALELYEVLGPFGLVFTDVRMPGTMNGIALAGELRRRNPSMPILITTGNPDLIPDEWRRATILKAYSFSGVVKRIRILTGG